MKGKQDSDSAGSSHDTDLYYVGGLPAGISESQLLDFFSRFVQIDAITLRPSKSPASSGYAFLRTSVACNLNLLVGPEPQFLGKSVTIQPAEDPKQKVQTLQSRVLRKVFIGNVPAKMTNEQVLEAVSVYGPVEQLTHFRSKSDRTKYCYAIMQHLEHAKLLASMKKLQVANPAKPNSEVMLNLGAFIPKSKHPLELLESKYTLGEHISQTQEIDSLPFNESLGSKTERNQNYVSFLGDSGHNNLDSTDRSQGLDAGSYRFPQAAIRVREIRPEVSPQRESRTLNAEDLRQGIPEIKTCFMVLKSKNLVLNIDYWHNAANIRLNVRLF